MEGAPKFGSPENKNEQKKKITETAGKAKDIIGVAVGAAIAATTPMNKVAVSTPEDLKKGIELVVRGRDENPVLANAELKENEKLVIQMPNEAQMGKVLESKKKPEDMQTKEKEA